MGIFSSIKSSLFGKKGTAPQSSLQGLFAEFPELKEVANKLVSQGADVSSSTDAYMPAEIAPLTTLQTKGIGGLEDYSQWQSDFKYGQKADQAFGMSKDLLSGVSPLVQQGQDYFAQGASGITEDEFGGAYDMFNNPWVEDVIGGVRSDINRDKDLNLSYARGAASDVGGFGGTRGALMESEVMRNAGDTLGKQTSQLRSSGYQSAVDNAMSMLTGGRVRSLAAGQGALSGANTLTSAGGTASNLGGNLMNARQTIENIKQQGTQGAINTAKGMIGVGGVERGMNQADLTRAAQIAGIPLDQMQTMAQLLGAFPSAATAGKAPTKGLFSSGGDVLGGLVNAGAAIYTGGASLAAQNLSPLTGGFNAAAGDQYVSGLPWR